MTNAFENIKAPAGVTDCLEVMEYFQFILNAWNKERGLSGPLPLELKLVNVLVSRHPGESALGFLLHNEFTNKKAVLSTRTSPGMSFDICRNYLVFEYDARQAFNVSAPPNHPHIVSGGPMSAALEIARLLGIENYTE